MSFSVRSVLVYVKLRRDQRRPVWSGWIAVMAIVLAILARIGAQPSDAATLNRTTASPFATASPSAVVLFVPLDSHANVLLRSTVPTLRQWIPSSQQLAVMPTKRSWFDHSRGEIDWPRTAHALLAELRRAQGARTILVMAVTSEAIYDPGTPQYAFVFGGYAAEGRQVAAVFGTRPMRVYQPQLERTRLTKFMLRYVGEIVCGLPRNSNPRSVLYTPVMGTADIDRMRPTLPSRCRR